MTQLKLPPENPGRFTYQGTVSPNQFFQLQNIATNALGQSIASGQGSLALGAGTTGFYSSSNNTLSYNIGAVATGIGAIAIGSQQGGLASFSLTGCPGVNCNGTATVALGATADNAVAIGTAASASFDNSTALGLNAATSRQNQQTFGTSINNYTLSGLTTGGNFQTGIAYMVTTDAVGNLGYTAIPTTGTNPCDTATQTGANAIGCGNGATASGISSSAYGQNANASATNSVALVD